ncbi:tetratricopeptide repeat protein [Paenalcaligenes niemegkensis]|uniref:tetratricopeptide repeat protein n=1 Tax=Paenalcaligenes niemegkensis TaxID=2895469 RepID=UPI001EE85265|nr:tetratricopeptide repeat protein [Paenalcaligenes niemegkensis]MCQ9617235.1 tetratricopeptide repeat protein [Paenalcaligenes niemegkensis]
MNLYSLLFSTLLIAPLYSGLTLAAAERLPAEQPVERIHLRSGELPEVSLSADILYRILVAEVAVQQGDYEAASQTFLSLSRDTLDPRFAQRAFQFSMADRNLSRGLRAAKEWSVLAPNDPEAKATALALEASTGNTAGLAQALYQRIESARDKEQAVVQALGIVSKMVDPRLAFDVLDQAMPEDVRTLAISHLALADAAWAAQRSERALLEARQALLRAPGSEAAAQRVLEYGLQVNADEALNEAQEFARQYPESRNLHLLLINRLVDNKRYNDALAVVRSMQRRNPEDFDLLYTEAEINTRAERFTEAKALLVEFISVQSQRRRSVRDQASNALANISDARLALVQIAEQQNDYAEAIQQLNLIEEPSLRFQATVHRAVLEARAGDMRRAQRTLDMIGTQDKQEQAVVALTRATVYRQAGRTDSAVEVLERADRELPDTPELKYDLAMLYERQGRIDDFERLMKQVIDLQPADANAYNALGYTYADQNRKLDEAQDLLEQALELEPDNPYILDSVGWYLYRVGDNQAALEYLKRSYEQLPEADVAAHLGEVFWSKGLKDEALRIWSEAFSLDPDNSTLLETLKRFDVQLP